MCVICVKPAGVELPTDTRLEEMFKANDDGSGFMYARDGKVIIRKGFMKLKHLKRALDQEQVSKSETVIYHFRIATAGSVSPKNCHPFPISSALSDLRSLRIETNIGMAHNGILSFKADHKSDLSDTMTFIRDILADDVVKNNMFEPAIFTLIEESIGTNKMVFLLPNGQYHLLGYWMEDDKSKDGLFYSNLTFRPAVNNWAGWEDWKDRNYSRNRGNSYLDNRFPTNRQKDADNQYTTGGCSNDLNTKKEDLAKSLVEEIVVVDCDETKCPKCDYTIASYQQLACSKCGIIFYRDYDDVPGHKHETSSIVN